MLWMQIAVATAQTSRGTLTGTVTDSSGAVITRATITLTHADTNVIRKTTTNSAGIYRFDAVELGSCSLTAEAQGFAGETKTGIEAQSAHTINIDFHLKVGAAKETLTVEASGVEIGLQTSEQTRAQSFPRKPSATCPCKPQTA